MINVITGTFVVLKKVTTLLLTNKHCLLHLYNETNDNTP